MAQAREILHTIRQMASYLRQYRQARRVRNARPAVDSLEPRRVPSASADLVSIAAVKSASKASVVTIREGEGDAYEGETMIVTYVRTGSLKKSAWVDYRVKAVHGTMPAEIAPTGRLTFAPGQSQASYKLHKNVDAKVEDVRLSVSLDKLSPGLQTLYSAGYRTFHDRMIPVPTPPRLLDVVPTFAGGGLAQVTLRFSLPLWRRDAESQFYYSVGTEGKDHKLNTYDDRYIVATSATYDPATYTVTATFSPAASLKKRVYFDLSSSLLDEAKHSSSDNDGDGWSGGFFIMYLGPGPKIGQIVRGR
jgi:hypothetical protein